LAISFSLSGCGGKRCDSYSFLYEKELKKATIQKVIKCNRKSVDRCYAMAKRLDRQLKGKVVVNFMVAPDGSVARPVAQESTLGPSPVPNCVLDALLKMKFPSHDEPATEVIYPFYFGSTN
jgi:hypothetical protein